MKRPASIVLVAALLLVTSADSQTVHAQNVSRKHKPYPEKYSLVYMPVSLAAGQVRTPEFSTEKQWYDIMVQVEKPLPFTQMRCMMGVTSGPLDTKECSSNDPLLRADWKVWQGDHLVYSGSIPDGCGCVFLEKSIFKLIGSFAAQAGEKYVVQVQFTKDGTALDVASPKLIVIRHRDMWSH